MALRDLSMDELRGLIERQMEETRKRKAEIEELERLTNKSLAEFMRRVVPARPEGGEERDP